MNDQRSKGFIRMALMGSAFVALTVFLIVFQPGSPRPAQYEAELNSDVTRVAPDLDKISAPLPTSEPDLFTPTAVSVVLEPTPKDAPFGPNTKVPNTLRDMTFEAITNLKSATTGEVPAPGEPGSLLHGVVQRSLSSSGETGIGVVEQPLIAISQPTPQSDPRKYFTRPGDTLVTIAQEVYGDVDMASQIFLTNRMLMSEPGELRPGMVLELP